jgi:hypothetical protein
MIFYAKDIAIYGRKKKMNRKERGFANWQGPFLSCRSVKDYSSTLFQYVVIGCLAASTSSTRPMGVLWGAVLTSSGSLFHLLGSRLVAHIDVLAVFHGKCLNNLVVFGSVYLAIYHQVGFP